jgi:hypothetical protein
VVCVGAAALRAEVVGQRGGLLWGAWVLCPVHRASLTGLSSLSADGYAQHGESAPLEALQQLTHLSLGHGALQPQDSAVLASLGALRTLEVHFVGPAAAAAAGLHRLQGVTVLEMGREAAEPIAPIQLAGGCCLRLRGESALGCFDTRQVHVLELSELAYLVGIDAAAVSQALRSSPQLRALQLESSQALHPQVLQAVAACSQLASLRLAAIGEAAPAAQGLAALAQGCNRLRRLTLRGIEGLSADTALPALMRLPCLRLLRLLGCGMAVGQTLVGRLGLHQLQVDVVVVADGLLRAEWMMDRLAQGWMH